MASAATQPANGGPMGLVSTAPHQNPNHSGRLRYADPQDLPSFPSLGLKADGAAAGAAASLGWEHQKPVEIWQPDKSASASAAAVLAKDYKMAPLWQPQRSDVGYRAATLAAGSAANTSVPEAAAGGHASASAGAAAMEGGRGRHAKHMSSPPSLSQWGNEAANLAVRSSMRQPSPSKVDADTNASKLARQGSLSAAKGAMAMGVSRPRSISSPQPAYPDEANAARNALNAATVSHRASVRTQAIPFDEAGAVPFTTMDRSMYTSRPPVQPEVDEKRRNDVLHASAVAMAKRMYTQQQRMIETAARNAAVQAQSQRPGHRRAFSSSDGSEVENTGVSSSGGLGNLQEAAYRLAQERLAKLHDQHQKDREYREYYGSSPTPGQQRNFSIRGKLRRRSSSDGDVRSGFGRNDDDRQRSQQIRQQMSLFSAKLSEVDEQKRTRDREALLAAAQRNVKAQLQGMDDKMYAESGKLPKSTLGEWQSKAHSAAVARSEGRKDVNAGKVDIGGGKFMDQAEVDAIAARKVRPVLEEINEKAEKERERQIAAKLEEEARKEEADKKRQREKEVADIHKKLKEQQKEEDRARAAELKAQEKAKKEEEKAAKAEQKRQAKEEKAKGKEIERESHDEDDAAKQTETTKSKILPAKLGGKRKDSDPARPTTADKPTTEEEGEATSPSSKVKSWWKKLGRSRATSAAEAPDDKAKATAAEEKGFIGGAALANLEGGTARDDNKSGTSEGAGAASMREVAMAGRKNEPGEDEIGESSGTQAIALQPEPAKVERATPAIETDDVDADPTESDKLSSVSSLSSDDRFVEAREETSGLDTMGGLRAPGKFKGDLASLSGGSTHSIPKESKFHENIE